MRVRQNKLRTDDEFVLYPETKPKAASGERTGETGWLAGEEGQLAVDVYETDGEIVVKSPIAGVLPDDLEVFVHNDMLTVRGKRSAETEIARGRDLVRECHWGSFSRSIILPTEIDAERISAALKNGVLTVRLPKIERSKKIIVTEE